MIIFFNKKTGEIYGTVSGRVHSEDEIKNAMVKPVNVPIEDVGSYVAEFEPVVKSVLVPVTEYRMVDLKTKKVELFDTGNKKKVKVGDGMKAVGRHAAKVESFEKDTSEIYKHKIKLDKNGNVSEFVKK